MEKEWVELVVRKAAQEINLDYINLAREVFKCVGEVAFWKLHPLQLLLNGIIK